jgi:hypothetical protein
MEPFVFYTERRLVQLTGRRAGTLPELHKHLQEVSGAAIFYHTHHQYLSHHFETPRFYNDFAAWAARALQENRLAEKLAAVDLLAFGSVRELREAILAPIEAHLEAEDGPVRTAPADDLFHFCESQSFVMRTGLVAHDVPEFFQTLRRITNVSLFFHFFEARLRLERPADDFSQWLRYCGHPQPAAEIEHLDPYSMTLDEFRDEIIRVGERHGFA